MQIPFVNAYTQLPEECFQRVSPTPVQAPQLIKFNNELARQLGVNLDGDDTVFKAQLFSGNRLPENSDPIAMAYGGHQFGYPNPELGDGRAILLGDVVDDQGSLRDIQLKGSGRTPFSRSGDGRSPLGPAMREYLLCEAMYHLGVPTTRALALVTSGEWVVRQMREPGAIFTRVAASHIRVGTFEYFAMRRRKKTIRALADHVLERHYPHIDPQADDRYLTLFKSICQRQAELIAQWMLLGFIHGVMNTDNMTVSGETIDYGPCAFMDAYQADKVYSSIDQEGRYAFQNQPAIGQWNLSRLGESMVSLFSGGERTAIALATEVLDQFSYMYAHAWERGMSQKLGFSEVKEGDRQRALNLLSLLEQAGLDFTLFFRRLGHMIHSDPHSGLLIELFSLPGCRNHLPAQQSLQTWLDEWRHELKLREPDLEQVKVRMESVNPAIIPRNHRVAEAIKAAEEGDFQVFENLLQALQKPYEENPKFIQYQQPPLPEQQVLRTFCGT